MKAASPDACVVAEVMSYPAGLVAAPGLPDATMNYVARRALLDWIRKHRENWRAARRARLQQSPGETDKPAA